MLRLHKLPHDLSYNTVFSFSFFLVVEASPTCLGYTNFLMAQAYGEDLPVAFAAILPCYVIYNQVGKYIVAQWAGKDCVAQEKHPYRKWIELYGGEDFDRATKEACATCDRMAASANPETKQRMLQAYLQVCLFVMYLFIYSFVCLHA